MPWPGITDFSDAIQQPGLCFAGTELEDATVAVSGRGMPLVYSGAFACVYSVSVGSQSFAVRCFTREVRDQQERYHELSDYLLDVLPPSFVHFEYAASGIRLRGEWYPVVKMEWVDGKILSGFVESNLGDPNALRRLAAQWRGGPAASLAGSGLLTTTCSTATSWSRTTAASGWWTTTGYSCPGSPAAQVPSWDTATTSIRSVPPMTTASTWTTSRSWSSI